MFFTKIKGHDFVLSQFKEWLLKESFSGVYLLCGPKGVGKYSTAKLLSKYVLCNGLKDDGCRCELCKQYPAIPDYLEIGNSEETEIKVADIDRVEEFVALVPFKSKYRVVLIDNADNLNLQASNKLLKLLEDSKSHTLFFLISSFPEKLLQTVYSRTCQVEFKALQSEALVEILKAQGFETGKVESFKGAIPYFSQSILNNASKYCEYIKEIPRFLTDFSKKTEDEILSYVSSVGEKEELIYFIETLLIYTNDILKIKYDGQDSIIFKKELDTLAKLSIDWTDDVCIALIEKLRKIIFDNNKNLYIKLYPRVRAAISWIFLILKTEIEKRKKKYGV